MLSEILFQRKPYQLAEISLLTLKREYVKGHQTLQYFVCLVATSQMYFLSIQMFRNVKCVIFHGSKKFHRHTEWIIYQVIYWFTLSTGERKGNM